jgi:hypothetical protein
MTNHVLSQPALSGMQSVIQALLGLEAAAYSKKTRRWRDAGRTEVLFKQLTATGDLLLDVLRYEQESAAINLTEANIAELEQWKECRRTADRLVGEYVAVIGDWRRAVEAGCRQTESDARPAGAV